MKFFNTKKYMIGIEGGAWDGVILNSERKEEQNIQTTIQVGKIFFPYHNEFKQKTTIFVFFWIKIIVVYK